MTVEPISDERLAEIRAGLEGVTPGPWTFFPPERGTWRTPATDAAMANSADEKVIDCLWGSATDVGIRTYHHIANCSPDAIAALIARLDKAEADAATARGLLSSLLNGDGPAVVSTTNPTA